MIGTTAILFLILSIYIFFYKPWKILYVLFGSYIMTLLMQWYSLDFKISIWGFALYPVDILSILMTIKLFVNFIKNPHIKKHLGVIYLLFFIILVSALRGITIFGINSYFMGDFRKFYSFIISIIYFKKYPIDFSNTKNVRFVDKAAIFMLLYCYLYWFIFCLTGYSFNSVENSMRLMHSDAAVILCLYTIYKVKEDLFDSSKKYLSFLTIMFILAIILLQHNSVYMTFASGCLIVLFGYKNLFKGISKKLLLQIICIALILVITINLLGQTEIIKTIVQTFDKFSQAKEHIGTIGTRYDIWTLNLATLNGVTEWLFGKPMGNGYGVSYLGTTWSASVHSMYVEFIMRVGVLGLILMMSSMLYLIVQGIKEHKLLITAFSVGLMFYWYPYSITLEAGVVIGNMLYHINNKE